MPLQSERSYLQRLRRKRPPTFWETVLGNVGSYLEKKPSVQEKVLKYATNIDTVLDPIVVPIQELMHAGRIRGILTDRFFKPTTSDLPPVIRIFGRYKNPVTGEDIYYRIRNPRKKVMFDQPLPPAS